MHNVTSMTASFLRWKKRKKKLTWKERTPREQSSFACQWQCCECICMSTKSRTMRSSVRRLRCGQANLALDNMGCSRMHVCTASILDETVHCILCIHDRRCSRYRYLWWRKSPCRTSRGREGADILAKKSIKKGQPNLLITL